MGAYLRFLIFTCLNMGYDLFNLNVLFFYYNRNLYLFVLKTKDDEIDVHMQENDAHIGASDNNSKCPSFYGLGLGNPFLCLTKNVIKVKTKKL